MAYAQINYQQKQGMTAGGKSPYYTIAQIGCFITAFCNLMERFGVAINPAQMDNTLAARRAYIDVDDGIYDDVGWGTISAVYGDVVVSGTGAGAPPHSNAIVKFNYRSPNSGRFTTHFALVADVSKGLILDSWDGVIKHWSVYGGPIAYATYVHNKPQPVQPINQGDIPMNDGDITNMYRTVLGRDPDAGGLNTYRGMAWSKVFYSLANSDEFRIRQQQRAQELADIRAALENERNKPPKEVIKEVEKIVEKIVEVPVEVIKEVPAPADPDDITVNKNVFWDWLSGLLSKFKKKG